METEYSITFKDFRAAQWLYLKKSSVSMFLYVVFNWIFPVTSVLLLLMYLYTRNRDDYETANQISRNLLPMFVIFTTSVLASVAVKALLQSNVPKEHSNTSHVYVR